MDNAHSDIKNDVGGGESKLVHLLTANLPGVDLIDYALCLSLSGKRGIQGSDFYVRSFIRRPSQSVEDGQGVGVVDTPGGGYMDFPYAVAIKQRPGTAVRAD